MEDAERTGEKMDFDFDGGYAQLPFIISVSLYKRFLKTVRDEGQGVARVVNQFLIGYILFLDSTFLKPGKKGSGPTRAFRLRIPKVVCDRYKDKCGREGIGVRAPVLQFISNYLDFHENGSNEPVRERKRTES